MTERSYFWDGTTIGDADQAPYQAELFADLLGKMHTNRQNFVLSGLAVTTSAGMVIDIQLGFALVGGYFFTSTDSVLPTVPPNATGLPRIDRVIVRINKNTEMGEILVLQGTPNIAPAPAPISSDPNLLDLPLASIYVPSGLAAVLDKHIWDERLFYITYSVSASMLQYTNDNLMPNSEFMAGAGTCFDGSPAMWLLAGTPTFTVYPKFDRMSRGSVVEVNCPTTNDGITTTVPNVGCTTSLDMTVKVLVDVLEGEVLIDVNGMQSLVPPTNGPQEFIYYLTVTNVTPDVTFQLYNPNATPAIFRLGQVTLSYGNAGTPYLPKKEIIFFSKPVIPDGLNITDTQSFSGVLSNIRLNADVGGELSPLRAGLSGLITRIDGESYNTATEDTMYIVIQDIDLTTYTGGYLRLELAREANDTTHSVQGFVGLPFTAIDGIQYYALAWWPQHVGINHIGCQT